MEREVRRLQFLVRTLEGLSCSNSQLQAGSRLMPEGTARSTRMQLVLRANVGTRIPVAGCTRRTAITARLHVPEQSLAKCNRLLFVFDEVGKIVRHRNGDRLQWSRSQSFLQNANICHHRAVRNSSGLRSKADTRHCLRGREYNFMLFPTHVAL